MSDQASDTLLHAIRTIATKLQRFQNRPLGEQNTKASLIEPILEALGWDTRDPDEVHREFKPTSQDTPVDYALCLDAQPRLFVEAKGLGETLTDRKWIRQMLGYSTMSGVGWCALTDGDEWRVYNASARVDADQKLLCLIKLSASQDERSLALLNLLSKKSVEAEELEELWNTQFVDRRVREAVRRMVETADKGLVRLIRRQIPKISPKDIGRSLRQVKFAVESDGSTVSGSVSQEKIAKPANYRRVAAARKAAAVRRANVSLVDLMSAGFLPANARLFRKYKGTELAGKLLPNGKVEFQGKAYDSCSTAAIRARATVIGRPMNTNGWDFWQFLDNDGKKTSLTKARRAYLAKNQ